MIGERLFQICFFILLTVICGSALMWGASRGAGGVIIIMSIGTGLSILRVYQYCTISNDKLKESVDNAKSDHDEHRW